MYKKKKPQTERYDMQKLLTDRDSKEEYAKKIESELHKLDTDKPADIRLEDLFNVVTTSAKATLGIVKRTVKKGYYNNPKLLRRLVGTYQGAIMHYAAWLFFYRLAIMPTFSRAQFNCINMCSARITCESGDPRYLMALSYENCAILFHKIA